MAAEGEIDAHIPGSPSSQGLTHWTRESDPPRSMKTPRKAKLPPRRKQIHVNMLVIGQTGLGKTTFIKHMFEDYQSADFEPHDGSSTCMKGFMADPAAFCTHMDESVRTENEEYLIYYHVQDTPGYGYVDNEEHMQIIINFIREQKKEHFRRMKLKNEQGIVADGNPLREGRDDLLIDVCFYFIPPHRFSSMDQEFIQRLSEEVTVAPICAKADAMTDPERRDLQHRIMSQLKERDIQVCTFGDEIEETGRGLGLPKERLELVPPFAVVASNDYNDMDGRREPVRQYAWGPCEVNNPLHSDLRLIKDVITCAAIWTLREAKKRKLWEYNRRCLEQQRERQREEQRLVEQQKAEVAVKQADEAAMSRVAAEKRLLNYTVVTFLGVILLVFAMMFGYLIAKPSAFGMSSPAPPPPPPPVPPRAMEGRMRTQQSWWP